MSIYNYSFVANEPDDLHCLQASFAMAWEGLTGRSIDMREAERLTAFTAGRDTWPHAAMLAAAEYGLDVHYIQDFSPAGFLEDPEGELLRSLQNPEFVREILAATDAEKERALLKHCLAHPQIAFTCAEPASDDLRQLVQQPDTAVICNVNGAALSSLEGYRAHFVLLRECIPGRGYVVENPGLPPASRQQVSFATFDAAWAPAPGYANVLALSRAHQASPRP